MFRFMLESVIYSIAMSPKIFHINAEYQKQHAHTVMGPILLYELRFTDGTDSFSLGKAFKHSVCHNVNHQFVGFIFLNEDMAAS